jgi:hypothetical protein
MANNKKHQEASSLPAEPLGFSRRTRGLGAEYAHEQGWGLDQDERTKLSQTPENPSGKEYDYGARDFGDEPRNTEGPQEDILQNTPESSSNHTAKTNTDESETMSTKPNEQMQPQKESQKKHGNPLDRPLDKAASHSTGANKDIDPVPEPETGNHAHSHAAHLENVHGNAHEHTKPAGDLRQGSAPGALREPPQEVSRIGKQHRGQ